MDEWMGEERAVFFKNNSIFFFVRILPFCLLVAFCVFEAGFYLLSGLV